VSQSVSREFDVVCPFCEREVRVRSEECSSYESEGVKPIACGWCEECEANIKVYRSIDLMDAEVVFTSAHGPFIALIDPYPILETLLEKRKITTDFVVGDLPLVYAIGITVYRVLLDEEDVEIIVVAEKQGSIHS